MNVKGYIDVTIGDRIVSHTNLVTAIGLEVMANLIAGSGVSIYGLVNAIQLGSGTTQPTSTDTGIEIAETDYMQTITSIPPNPVRSTIKFAVEAYAESAFIATEAVLWQHRFDGYDIVSRVVFPAEDIKQGEYLSVDWYLEFYQ